MYMFNVSVTVRAVGSVSVSHRELTVLHAHCIRLEPSHLHHQQCAGLSSIHTRYILQVQLNVFIIISKIAPTIESHIKCA